ncbi:MAG: hypothetical protein BGO57_12285 [Sphingomonadales bacterium 63-6]|nr:MAG: hypothetical protein BGO57_12285 [Sphingomonadales bacterium 63-6]
MRDFFSNLSSGTKHTIDAVSIGTVVASIVQWLPSIAALLSVVWTAIRIYESPTIQRLVRRGEGQP